MVKYSQANLSNVFKVLADPVRRRILERLSSASQALSAGELAGDFDISLPAISKHLKALEVSGLIKRTVEGRTHFFEPATEPLAGAEAWLSTYMSFWQARLDRLEQGD